MNNKRDYPLDLRIGFGAESGASSTDLLVLVLLSQGALLLILAAFLARLW